jgi:hypothetical protein
MIGKEKTSTEKIIASAIHWHQPVAESFNNWVYEFMSAAPDCFSGAHVLLFQGDNCGI